MRYSGVRPEIRTLQRIWTILFLLAPWPAAGADQSLNVPDWLAPLPEAKSITRTASATSVDLSYLVPLSPTEAAGRYQERLQKAGVRFGVNFDGIGNAISASTESISCIVHISEADSGSRVRVSCAPEIPQPSSQVIAPSTQSPAVAENRQAVPIQPVRPSFFEKSVATRREVAAAAKEDEFRTAGLPVPAAVSAEFKAAFEEGNLFRVSHGIRATMTAYNTITIGESYESCVYVIGAPGEEISRSDFAGNTTVTYSWKNANGSNMIATFQNDRLVSKAQSGLP
jgi:hypothetical protein